MHLESLEKTKSYFVFSTAWYITYKAINKKKMSRRPSPLLWKIKSFDISRNFRLFIDI